MTLCVCLKANGAIVMAADSRGTIGDPRGLTAINDSETKLFQLGVCGLTIAGASEMGAALLDEWRTKGLNSAANVEEAIFGVRTESLDSFQRWFANIPPAQRPGVLVTVAGYRFPAGMEPEPKVYLLNSQANFAPQLFNNPCMSGVPQYAVYLVHRYYDQTIPPEQAKALAEYLIAETASQDPKVGGPIHIAEITPDNGYRELTEDEVKRIHEENEQLNERMSGFFLERGSS